MAGEGKLECLPSLSFLWAEQLSKATFFPLSRCSRGRCKWAYFNAAKLSNPIQGTYECPQAQQVYFLMASVYHQFFICCCYYYYPWYGCISIVIPPSLFSSFLPNFSHIIKVVLSCSNSYKFNTQFRVALSSIILPRYIYLFPWSPQK